MKTTLLIDADIVAFQVAAVSQKAFKWDGPDGPESLAVDDFEDVAPRVDVMLAGFLSATKADGLIICLSCPTEEGWRIGLYPKYKANRDYSKRPVHLSAVKDYMAEKYPSYRKPTLEADDIMGILSTHPKLVSGKRIIVSEDKDMQTIPGWLWNPAKDTKPRRISEEQADFYHMYQTLVGDTTDGYKGCPGVGPVKAEKILASEGDRWENIVAAYEAKGLTEGDAILQARMARICRADDYDFKKQEVKLWTPQ